MKHMVTMSFFNLKTGINWSLSRPINTNDGLFNCELGTVTFDFENVGFKNFLVWGNDNVTPLFAKKFLSALKRRLKGTSKGISIVYRDEDNLIIHCYIEIVSILD